jgi:hypothetical protein
MGSVVPSNEFVGKSPLTSENDLFGGQMTLPQYEIVVGRRNLYSTVE